MPLTEIPSGERHAPPERESRRAVARWVVTIAATVASAHALDGVAALAGVALVATAALDGVPAAALWAVLVASYAGWLLALSTAVRANWQLLDIAGVSTSAVSKLAHDVAVRRGGGDRARRWAAAAGYAGTELVKEIPYYAGAFGASALTDAVSAHDAVVFLVGTNLVAAGYEFTLALATRGVLSRGRRRARGGGRSGAAWWRSTRPGRGGSAR